MDSSPSAEPQPPLRPRRRAPSARPAPALVPSLSRALNLLDRLAQQRAPMSLARLASDLALPKSSVHGLCNTLVSFGYLRRQADGAFLIGPRVMSLAEAFVAGTSVVHEFDRLWRDAGRAPEETIILSVLSGAEVVYVAVRNGRRPLGLAFSVGMRLPAHLAATGKAMLAFRGAELVRVLFPEGALPQLTGRGPADTAALRRELKETRRRGHSIDDEGVREGVYCLAAPVFDAAGDAVAGVGVCIHKALAETPAAARHRETVIDVARTLSRRLGAAAPPEA